MDDEALDDNLVFVLGINSVHFSLNQCEHILHTERSHKREVILFVVVHCLVGTLSNNDDEKPSQICMFNEKKNSFARATSAFLCRLRQDNDVK